MSDWIAEGRIAIYLAEEYLGASGDDLEAASNTSPLPEQAHVIMGIVRNSGYLKDKKSSSYSDAWKKLHEEVLEEKTSWGKEELKKRMDKLLIECMESYL